MRSPNQILVIGVGGGILGDIRGGGREGEGGGRGGMGEQISPKGIIPVSTDDVPL